MANYDEELLETARRLITREAGQRGRLPRARIRRSVSTSYYAIFHFLVDEAGRLLIGAQNELVRRRRIFSRQFTHTGIRLALDRVRGTSVHGSVEDFLRHPAAAEGRAFATLDFVRQIATAFLDAHSKRNDADYDLNEELSEADAWFLAERIEQAIASWRRARTEGDRDLKQALCILMLLGGKLRSEQ
jgi:uncharacterized protein (UPF0332 family)